MVSKSFYGLKRLLPPHFRKEIVPLVFIFCFPFPYTFQERALDLAQLNASLKYLQLKDNTHHLLVLERIVQLSYEMVLQSVHDIHLWNQVLD